MEGKLQKYTKIAATVFIVLAIVATVITAHNRTSSAPIAIDDAVVEEAGDAAEETAEQAEAPAEQTAEEAADAAEAVEDKAGEVAEAAEEKAEEAAETVENAAETAGEKVEEAAETAENAAIERFVRCPSQHGAADFEPIA